MAEGVCLGDIIGSQRGMVGVVYNVKCKISGLSKMTNFIRLFQTKVASPKYFMGISDV